MRAGLYARVSREEQLEGYSLEEQLAAMRRFCRERGWTVAREYTEEGYTGTVTARPVFSEALADCEAGRLDILLTHQLDRFYRNLALQLDTLGQLGKWGVGYLSVTEQIDYSTPQGMLFLQMLGAFNEYYVANLSRETSKGKRGRAKKGLSNASTAPHGYERNEEGADVLEPEAAQTVTLAFEAYATGKHSDLSVATLLNLEGLAPPGRAVSGRWTREGVRYVLTNPFYVGLVRHGEDLFPGQHEALIDRGLWDRVQALRARRSHGKGAGRRPHRVYLLARVARCAACGLRLVAQSNISRNGTAYPYYYCPSSRRGVDCPTGGRMVPAQELEGQVRQLIKRLELPADWRERLEELSQADGTRENARAMRRRLQAKLRKLRFLYLEEEDMSEGEYRRAKAELQAQLDALRPPEAPEVEEAGEVLESLGQEWAQAPRKLQAEMLKTIFQGIRIDVDGRRVVAVRPWPPFWPLFRMDGLEEREEGVFYVREEAGSEGGAVAGPAAGGPESETAGQAGSQKGSLTGHKEG